ncbi:hypothetical protein Hanom_Chr05g00394991 [Helianthus anomalus]
MTLRPGSVSTMSEAPLAASVASATAIPISAFFKAGASFTPSPVIPQMCFLSCNFFTISYLYGNKNYLFRVSKGSNNGRINSVLVFSPRSPSSIKQNLILINTFSKNLNQIFINAKLVKSQCSGFITAKYVHSRHFFNGSHSFSNSSLL